MFIKLSKLGVGMFMLNALKDMYTNTLAYVSIEGEFSNVFQLNAGVLQGASTSTLLFMAYTSDIITIFKTLFIHELYIYSYHLLLHADDSLILATSKKLLIEKFKSMEKYCSENMLKLQPKKCGFMCINSEEKDSFTLKTGTINHLNETSYLGSLISSYGNVTHDIQLEIKSKTASSSSNMFFSRIALNSV